MFSAFLGQLASFALVPQVNPVEGNICMFFAFLGQLVSFALVPL